MKKTLILAAVAVVAMASCAKNEVIAPSTSSAIGFDTFVGNSTKAEAVTSFVADDVMNVDAYYTGAIDFKNLASTGTATTPAAASLYMDNVEVTKESDGVWTYSPIAYWPKADTEKISFFANSIGEGTGTAIDFNAASGDELNVISFTYENPATAALQKDLMIASLLNKVNTAGKLKFDFKHALSQLKFTFVDATADTNSPITLDKVVVTYGTGFLSQRTFTFDKETVSTGDWSTSTGDTAKQAEETFTIGTVLPTTAPSDDTTIAPIMLIPQGNAANTGIDVTVTYTVKPTSASLTNITNTVTAALTIPTGGFEQAKIYTYAVSVSLNAIEFGEPTITDGWSAGTGGTVTIK